MIVAVSSLEETTTSRILDTSLHWCYSLPGYEKDTIAKNGVPIITHLHGGHTDYQFDGNPEFFYSPSGPKAVRRSPVGLCPRRVHNQVQVRQ